MNDGTHHQRQPFADYEAWRDWFLQHAKEHADHLQYTVDEMTEAELTELYALFQTWGDNRPS